MQVDILIRGGWVVDGAGNPSFRADVAVQGGRVRLLRGNTSAVQAGRVIDATGKVVCPGFIDMHAHSALLAPGDPRHLPKVLQGVTTEVVGVDGLSYVPFPSPQDFWMLAHLNAGLDGRPPPDLPSASVDAYLSYYEGKTPLNICLLIGNTALRIAAVGWEERRATPEEVRRQQELLKEGMGAGAFGLSTGLTYPPGSYADTAELIALCQVVAQQGGIYVTHVRYTLGDRFADPFREAIAIARASGCPLHISHFHTPVPGGARRLLALVDAARAEGLPVTFDSYPYPYTSTRLVALLPEWVHNGGPQALLARIKDPEVRLAISRDPDFSMRDYRSYLVSNLSTPRWRKYDGWSLAAIAQETSRSIVDTLCAILVDEDLNPCYTGLGGNPVNIREFFRHPAHMVGSDALLLGEHPNPRTYGCYPFILGDMVREEGVLSLPEAIRKMTSFPAQTLGLPDRGLLRDGFWADVVVFDPQRVRALATLDHPTEPPVGIEWVLVNGVVVVEEGRFTGARPGRALRHRP
jgi:N-acyl-D-amino-acid deacylase